MGHDMITLKARGRRAKLGSRPLVAIVGLGFAKPGYGGVYRHAEVFFRTLESDGTTTLCGPDVSMRFQTHAMGSTDNPSYDVQGPRGFLAMGTGEWVGCYGGEITGKFGYHADGKTLARVIALVDRARDVTRYPLCGRFRGCELLRLIIGLQRCGVEVRIHNHQLAERPSVSRLAA